MGGALGAFSRTGPNGEAAQIFLNKDWATSNTVDSITGVVLEEVGHAIDYLLNEDLDSPGDEGELFSNNLRNIAVSNAEKDRVLQEEDQISVSYQGSHWSAEAALTSVSSTTGTRVGTTKYGYGNYITFAPITIGAPSGDVLLNINAYDIDLSSGEIDSVYVADSSGTYQYVGTLNGYNDTWTWTTLDITSVATAAGNYTVQIRPNEDQFGNKDTTNWVVASRYADITTGTTNGYITDLSLNSSGGVSADILVDTTGTYELDYYLIDSSGNVDATYNESNALTKDVTFSNGPDTLSGWSSVADGTYKLRAILTTGGSTIEDIDTWTIVKSGGSVTTTPDSSSSDTTPPTVAISSSNSTIHNNQSELITFTLSEAASDFIPTRTSTGLTVTGGTLTQWTKVSDTVYTAVFKPINSSGADGWIIIANNYFTDVAGNANQDGTDADNSLFIRVAPTAIIRTSQKIVQPGSFNKTLIELTEGSNDFTRASITSNVAIRGFRKISDSLYEVSYRAPRGGKVNINVIAGAYTDLGGVAGIAHENGLDSTVVEVIRTNSIGNLTTVTRGRGGASDITVGRRRAQPGLRSVGSVSSRSRRPVAVGRSASAGIFRGRRSRR